MTEENEIEPSKKMKKETEEWYKFRKKETNLLIKRNFTSFPNSK